MLHPMMVTAERHGPDVSWFFSYTSVDLAGSVLGIADMGEFGRGVIAAVARQCTDPIGMLHVIPL